MKVLFVIGNLRNGGAQRVVSVIASQLAEKHDVTLVVYAKDEHEYYVSDKVNKIYLCDNYQKYNQFSEIKKIKSLRKAIKIVKPDIGVGFIQGGYGLYIASVGIHFPKIASLRNNPDRVFKKRGVRAYIEKKWFASANSVVLQSNGQKELVKNYGWKNTIVIPNPISEICFTIGPISYNSQVRSFVMIGRIEKQKDYPTLIEAVKIVVDEGFFPNVLIYGEGSMKSEIEKLITEYSLDQFIKLKGWTNDVFSVLGSADAYILSSKYEGMPNSLMEAMSVGLPCISTNCNTGPGDLIEDGVSGFLVPVGNVRLLADAIEKTMTLSIADRERIGVRARRFILDYCNPSYVASKWEQLFESLIRKTE